MKFSTCILAVLPALTMALPAAVVAPGQVTVSNIAYGGTGCGQGTAEVSATPDSLNLEFRNFTAGIGPGIAITENRKNCQLNVGIVAPPGFRWTLNRDQYKGWVDLDAGISVNMKTTVYFSGSTDQSNGFTATINGPQSGAFEVEETTQSPPVSPCGGESAININLQVSLRKASSASSSARGLAVTKDLNVDFRQVFAFGWETC